MDFKGFKSGIEFQTWWGPFCPLALALGVGLLIGLGGGGVVSFPFQMVFHELGHAHAAWFSGHAAIPLPFITFYSGERSTFAMLSMCFLVGLLVYQSIKERKFVSAGFGVVLLLILFWGSFILDTINGDMYRTMGGLLGEFLLPAVVFVFYNHEVPRRLRWDFWRYLMVFPAAITYFSSLGLWRRARADPAQLPRGSLFGDEFGDIDRLIADYGWTEAGLGSFYFNTGLLIGLVVVVHLGIHLFLAYKKGDPERKAPPSFRPPPTAERESFRSRRNLGSDLPPPWDAG